MQFEPQPNHIPFIEIGHEIICMAVLSLPLIQEGQLSVTGENMCKLVLVNRLGRRSRPAQKTVN